MAFIFPRTEMFSKINIEKQLWAGISDVDQELYENDFFFHWLQKR